MLFEKANNNVTSLDLKAEIREVLAYEYRYKSLIERVYNKLDNQYLEFIGAWYHELLGSIRSHSLAQDRDFFENLDLEIEHKKDIYAQLLLYRYDQNISIMEDLHFEKTKDFLEQCQRNIKDFKVKETKTSIQRLKEAKFLKKQFDTELD